jgi:hypothetical protein
MTVETITGALAGVQFAFRCDATDLCEYARLHLAALKNASTAVPAVRSMVRWHDGQPPSKALASAELADMDRIDRDVYASAAALWWFRVDDLRDLFLRFSRDTESLAVEGDFYHRLGSSWLTDRLRRLRYWRRRGAYRQRRFPTLLAYLVYYPCWWYLEHTEDLHPIHAAGVLTNAGVILLAGASGVGKSTLAVALATTPGAQLLSDSFVLHNELDVLPVREPVLLDVWSRAWLGAAGDELRPIGRRYGLNRCGFQVPPLRISDGGRAALLLFPRRSRELSARRITAEEAHQRLSSIDMIINDLRRYWAYAAVLEQMVPDGLMARREWHIGRLVAGVPCYELGIAPDTTRAAVCDTIMRLLPDQRLRVVGKPQ